MGRQQLARFWQRWEDLRETLTAGNNQEPNDSIAPVAAATDAEADAEATAIPVPSEPVEDAAASQHRLWWAGAAAGSAGAWLLARRLLRGTKSESSEEAEIAAARARLDSVLPTGPFDNEPTGQQEASEEAVVNR